MARTFIFVTNSKRKKKKRNQIRFSDISPSFTSNINIASANLILHGLFGPHLRMDGESSKAYYDMLET